MTRKDYQKFADMIAALRQWHAMKPLTADYLLNVALVEEFAAIFANDNPRFDRRRFVAACAVEQGKEE